MRKMRVRVLYMAAVATAAVMFSGCASNGGYVNAKILQKDNEIRGIRTTNAGTTRVDTAGYKSYAHENNAYYRCNLRMRLYLIAKESLRRGYPYFALRFPDGSNPSPLPMVTTDKIVRYCVPAYYDKDTDFLDDKCGHIGFGTGTPAGPKRMDGIFYKKRNPFIPLWDAKRVIRELESVLKKECWNDNMEGFERVMNSSRDFGVIEVD